MTADNIPNEEIIKQFHKRFPEINIDILLKTETSLEKHADNSTIQIESGMSNVDLKICIAQ